MDLKKFFSEYNKIFLFSKSKYWIKIKYIIIEISLSKTRKLELMQTGRNLHCSQFFQVSNVLLVIIFCVQYNSCNFPDSQ